MIRRITLINFMSHVNSVIDLADGLTVLVGPNNSGKSTLLQAAMVWNLAMQKWWERKGPSSGSQAKDRSGVPITRQEFTALPLPSMDQLWTEAKATDLK